MNLIILNINQKLKIMDWLGYKIQNGNPQRLLQSRQIFSEDFMDIDDNQCRLWEDRFCSWIFSAVFIAHFSSRDDWGCPESQTANLKMNKTFQWTVSETCYDIKVVLNIMPKENISHGRRSKNHLFYVPETNIISLRNCCWFLIIPIDCCCLGVLGYKVIYYIPIDDGMKQVLGRAGGI